MNRYTITSHCFLDILKEMTTGLLLLEGPRDEKKFYMKLNYDFIGSDSHVTVLVTKCDSAFTNFKSFFTNTFSSRINLQTLARNSTVAVLEEKFNNAIRIRRVVYCGNALFSFVTDTEAASTRKDLILLKNYVSIRVMFHVLRSEEELFVSLLSRHISLIEPANPNVKFIIRKGEEHIYRNRMWMDDVFLTCAIFNSSCSSIFQASKNFEFRKKIMKKLRMKRAQTFEDIVGCLLLAQANNNFNRPGTNYK